MADKYIDEEEMGIYGAHAVRQIRRRVMGLVPQCDPAVNFIATRVEEVTAQVARSLGEKRDTQATLRQGTRAKKPALKQARQLLGRFSTHLGSHPPDTIDRRRFFTADGTAGGVGSSATKVLTALNHIASELNKPGHGVKDAASWRTEFMAAIDTLAPPVEQTTDTRADRRTLTPATRRTQDEWLQMYAVAKLVVEGILRMAGKGELMAEIFHDLAVPANAKVTEPPSDPAEPPTRGTKPVAAEVEIPGKD
ncbi:MAG TPA: hypothetical protein VH877_15150 [Polyangia bacterium]|jgi:hypothetical protein|nr:hypothetical protein [Polyangia bacterium]